MPDRFGQSGDYSAQFAYLADSYLGNLEQQAEKANARRESAQAAKDTEAFARYDAGKMSGQELLAYIRRRITETAYDPKQQAEWKKALLEYTDSINDANAATAFERSNDYDGYIEYLRGRMSHASPEDRAKLQEQINSLTDQRDSQNVTRGAERILLQIGRGKATYKDLLEFYQNALKNTRNGSAVRADIRRQITAVSERVRSDALNLRIGNLDAQLAANTITPQQYGRRLIEIARSSNLATTDPSAYNSLIQRGQQSIHTYIDMGELDEINGRLMRKEITPQEAANLIYAVADKWKVNSPADYQRLRNLAYQTSITPVAPTPGETPLPNPGVLGLPDDYVPNQGGSNLPSRYAFSWITQLDGSEFSQVNCVYASAAMLAYAMGYREQGGKALSGGDLRYLSGDRGIGTNLDEAQAALGKLGITGLKNWNDRHISFEGFKHRVGDRGMPAVLMGINNNLPDSLKAFSGAARGHGIFVAAYDAKKKAFLMYDPAVSKNRNPNYNGVWVDEKVIRNFGWGPGYSDATGSWNFSGQALFAPPGTIKGSFSANNVRRPSIHYVNVDDIPVRPETPRHYRGRNHRGPSTVEPVGNEAVDKKGRARAGASGKWNDEIPDTVEEVKQALQESRKRMQLIEQEVSKDGVTDEAMKMLDRERLDLYDQDVMYAEAAGLDSVQQDLIDDRTAFLASAQGRNSLAADVVMNTAIRDARKDFEIALKDPDPQTAIKSMQVIKGRLQILASVQRAGDFTDDEDIRTRADEGDDLSRDPKVPGNINQLADIIKVLDMVTTPGQGPISERLPDILAALDRLGASADQRDGDGNVKAFGTDLGNMVMQMADQRDAQDKIEAGTHIAATNGQTGGTMVAPLIPRYNPETGAEEQVPYFGENEQGPVQGIQVPVQTAAGVEMRWVVPGVQDTGMVRLQAKKNIPDYGIVAGQWLTENVINQLRDKGVLQQAIGSGQLVEYPYLLTMVRMPDRKVKGDTIKGQTFYQDTSGNWFTGGIPVNSFGAVGGKYIGANEDTTPQFEYRPYSTAGMYPTPFQGDRKAIQDAADKGLISIPTTYGRGRDGSIVNDPTLVPRFHTPYDPLSSAYMPGAIEPKESDEDRKDRLEAAVKSIFENVQRAKDQKDWLTRQGVPDITTPETPETMFPRQDLSSFSPRVPLPPTGLDAIGDYEAGQRAVDEPFNFPVPDKNTVGDFGMGSINKLAGSLGVKLGPKGPQGPATVDPRLKGPQGYTPPSDLKGPQGYIPPSPKTTRKAGGKVESNLPRIGSSVMIGGTRIDVPAPAKKQTAKTFSPPPPNKPKTQTGTGSAAAASIAMLTGNRQTVRGPGGVVKS